MLSHQLITHTERLRNVALQHSEWMDKLRAVLPANDERVRQLFSDARMTLGFIHSSITQIENVVGVARITGQIEQPPAEDLAQAELPIQCQDAPPDPVPPSRPERKRHPVGKAAAANDQDENDGRHIATVQPEEVLV